MRKVHLWLMRGASARRFNRSNPFFFDPREPIRFAGVRHCSPWFSEDYRLALIGGE